MLAYLFVIIAVAVRFLPHPMAFTPVGAALLFFGARGPRRRLWLPLVLLAASDVILTTLVYRYPFTWDHFVTWAWYAGMLWLGTTLRLEARERRLELRPTAKGIAAVYLENGQETRTEPLNLAGDPETLVRQWLSA